MEGNNSSNNKNNFRLTDFPLPQFDEQFINYRAFKIQF